MASRTCGAPTAKELERRRREAVDSLYAMSKPTRARMLLGIRESVKEGMVADPDMDDAKKQNVSSFVDMMWEDVMLIAEFKSQSALKGGRAVLDYEDNSRLGRTPAPYTLQRIRAWLLYTWLPFDKSIHGKVKDCVWLIMSTIAMIPFVGIRIIFFLVIFLLILSGCPADTYQIIEVLLTFKGTQFKSGGVILFIFGLVEYALCIHPGDSTSCTKDGPGYNIPVAFSLLDLIGSCAFCWVCFLYLPWSKNHEGEDHRSTLPDIEDDPRESFLPASPDQAEQQPRKRVWFLPSSGSKRILCLLLYDLVCFMVSCSWGCWLAYLDVALWRASTQEPLADVWRVYSGSAEARIAAFKARLLYNLLAMPFMFLMAPGLSMLVGLTRATGFNRQGHCVPFTLRPMPAKKMCRACGSG